MREDDASYFRRRALQEQVAAARAGARLLGTDMTSWR